MTDLSKGILDIGGFVLTKDTTIEEIQALPDTVRTIGKTRYPNLFFRASFLQPIVSNEICGQVFIKYDKTEKYPEITIWPGLDPSDDYSYASNDTEASAIAQLNAAKKWLKGLISEKPSADSDWDVLYSYDWGYIIGAIHDTRDYGAEWDGICVRFSTENVSK